MSTTSCVLIGDIVTIRSLKYRHYLTAEGILDDELYIGESKVFENNLFQVCLPRQYTAAMELDEFMQKELNGDITTANDYALRQLSALRRGAYNEQKLNAQYFQSKIGTPIHYGDQIQLLHLNSKKYVTIIGHEVALLERENIRVRLHSNGTEDAWLTILPRFKITQQGDLVFSNSEVKFNVSERNNEYLHVTDRSFATPTSLKGHREVNASLEPSTWFLSVYQSALESDSKLNILSTDLIYFCDPETQSYLSVIQRPVQITPYGAEDDMSDDESILEMSLDGEVVLDRTDSIKSSALWCIELKNRIIGGAIPWSTELVRLRHVNTGRYLSLKQTDEDEGEDGEYSLTVTSNYKEKGTLFSIHELHGSGTYLTNKRAVQLSHSQHYLERGKLREIDDISHYLCNATRNKFNATYLFVNKYISKISLESFNNSLQQKSSSSSSSSSFSSSSSSTSTTKFNNPSVKFHDVPILQPLDLYVGVSLKNYYTWILDSCEDFTNYDLYNVDENIEHYSSLWPSLSDHESNNFYTITKKAVYYLQGVSIFEEYDETDHLDNDEKDIKNEFGENLANDILILPRQILFCEQGTIVIILQLLNRILPLVKGKNYRSEYDENETIPSAAPGGGAGGGGGALAAAAVASSSTHTQADDDYFTNKDIVYKRLQLSRQLTLVSNFLFRLLFEGIKNNPKNQLTIACHLHVILGWVGIRQLAADVVKEMLRDNTELQTNKIGLSEIKIFTNQLVSGDMRLKSMYFAMLRAFCSCSGQGVSRNQGFVLEAILPLLSSIFISFTKNETTPTSTTSSSNEPFPDKEKFLNSLYFPKNLLKAPNTSTGTSIATSNLIYGSSLIENGITILYISWVTNQPEYSTIKLFNQKYVPINTFFKPQKAPNAINSHALSGKLVGPHVLKTFTPPALKRIRSGSLLEVNTTNTAMKRSRLLSFKSSSLKESIDNKLLNIKRKEHILEYLIAQFELQAELCLDRNFRSIYLIEKLLSYDDLITFLLSYGVHHDDLNSLIIILLGAIMKLIKTLYVDRESETTSRIPCKSILYRQLTDHQNTSISSIPSVKTEKIYRFCLLQIIITKHLKYCLRGTSSSSMNGGGTSSNDATHIWSNYTLNCILTLQKLIQLNYYGSSEKLLDIIPLLMELLNRINPRVIDHEDGEDDEDDNIPRTSSSNTRHGYYNLTGVVDEEISIELTWQERLLHFLNSFLELSIMMFLVLFSTILTFTAIFDSTTSNIFSILNIIISIIFLIEFLLRFYCSISISDHTPTSTSTNTTTTSRIRIFFQDNYIKIDLICIILDIILYILEYSLHQFSTLTNSLRVVRFIRILRILRIFRIVRFVKLWKLYYLLYPKRQDNSNRGTIYQLTSPTSSATNHQNGITTTSASRSTSANNTNGKWILPDRYTKASNTEIETMIAIVNCLEIIQNILHSRNLIILLKGFYQWNKTYGSTTTPSPPPPHPPLHPPSTATSTSPTPTPANPTTTTSLLSPRYTLHENNKKENDVSQIFHHVLEEINTITILNSSNENYLIDLLMYSNPKLVQSVLELLMSSHNTIHSMFSTIHDIQLISSPSNEKKYSLVHNLLLELDRHIETYPLWCNILTIQDEEISQRCINILEILTNNCRNIRQKLEFHQKYEPDVMMQNLLRNFNCWNICYKILIKLNLSYDGNTMSKSSKSTQQILKSTNSFLYWYLVDNKINQYEAYQCLDYFLLTIDKNIYSHHVITAIFYNNEILMKKISKHYIQEFIDKICELGRFPQYLTILSAITYTIKNNKNILENQYEIIKYISSPLKQKKILLFFCSINNYEYQRKVKLMASYLHKIDLNPEDIAVELYYHIELLRVLNGCTLGINNLTTIETKVQAMFNYLDIIDAIMDPQCLLLIKIETCLFFYNAILDVEMLLTGLIQSISIWKLFEYFIENILLNGKDEIRFIERNGWEHPKVSRQKLEYLIVVIMIIKGFFGIYFDMEIFKREVSKTSTSTTTSTRTSTSGGGTSGGGGTSQGQGNKKKSPLKSKSSSTINDAALTTTPTTSSTTNKSSEKFELSVSYVEDLITQLFTLIREIYEMDSILFQDEHKEIMYKALYELCRAQGKNIEDYVTHIGSTRHTPTPPTSTPSTTTTSTSTSHKFQTEEQLSTSLHEFLTILSSDKRVQSYQINEFQSILKKISSLPRLNDLHSTSILRYEPFLKKLVEHMRDSTIIVNYSTGKEKRLQLNETKTFIWLIKIFRTMIENVWGMTIYERDDDGGEEQDIASSEIITIFNTCGLTTLCLDFIAIGIDNELIIECVKLCVAMLFKEGGAYAVQEKIFYHLNEKNSELFFRQIKKTIQELISWHDWRGIKYLHEEDESDGKGTGKGQGGGGKGGKGQSGKGAGKGQGGGKGGKGDDDEVDIINILPSDFILIRFLQLMCEGHYLNNQDILREQPNNSISYNILEDLSQYYIILNNIPCRVSNIAAISVGATILEVIQGPCEGNQIYFTLQTVLIEIINKQLRTSIEGDCILYENLELKKGCVDILLGLLEGQGKNAHVFERILSVLHLDVIQILSNITPSKSKNSFHHKHRQQQNSWNFLSYLLSSENENDEEGQQQQEGHGRGGGDGDEDDEEIAEIEQLLKTKCLVLLQVLGDHKSTFYHDINSKIPTPGSSTTGTSSATGTTSSNTAGIACVEIMWRGELHRRFYTVPLICYDFNDTNKSYFVETVNRSSQENKLLDLYKKSKEIYIDLLHQKLLREIGISKLFSRKNQNYATWITFGLCCSINLIMLLYYNGNDCFHGYDPNDITTYQENLNCGKPYLNPIARNIVNILNILQICFSSFTLIMFMIVRAPVQYLIHKQHHHSIIWSILLTAIDPYTLYYFIYVILAGISLSVDHISTLFLLDIVMKNSYAMDVIVAVFKPIRQLMMACLLFIVVGYIFAMVMFLYLNTPDALTYPNDCQTLYSCLKFAVGSGSSGDFGPYMTQRLSPGQWIFYFAFDLAIRFVLLNVIRGITVDTFSELRIVKLLRLKDTLDTCFICGINKQIFDRDRTSHGFIHHIKHEHNMWNYLYFIIYIWEQDKDDDDGLEQYVRRSIEVNDINWIPTNKAMGLSSTYEKHENQIKLEFMNHIQHVEGNIMNRINDYQMNVLTKTIILKNELPNQENTFQLNDDDEEHEPSTWRSQSIDGIAGTPGVAGGGGGGGGGAVLSATTSYSDLILRTTGSPSNRKKNFPHLTLQILEINGFNFPSSVYDKGISCIIRCGQNPPQILDSQTFFHHHTSATTPSGTTKTTSTLVPDPSSALSTQRRSSAIHYPTHPIEIMKFYQNTSDCNCQSVIIQITRNSLLRGHTTSMNIGSKEEGEPSSQSTTLQSSYQRVFMGYIHMTVGELIESLDTIIEKEFEATVLNHECEGTISFIASLGAVVINESLTSSQEELPGDK